MNKFSVTWRWRLLCDTWCASWGPVSTWTSCYTEGRRTFGSRRVLSCARGASVSCSKSSYSVDSGCSSPLQVKQHFIMVSGKSQIAYAHTVSSLSVNFKVNSPTLQRSLIGPLTNLYLDPPNYYMHLRKRFVLKMCRIEMMWHYRLILSIQDN